MMPMSNYVKVFRIKGCDGSEKLMELPVQLDVDRPKRPRTTFLPHQLDALENAFKMNGYLSGEKRAGLAEKLQLSDTQVKVWFQNRRTKGRKQGREPKNEKSTKKSVKNEENLIQFPPNLSPISFQTTNFPYFPMIFPIVPENLLTFDLNHLWPNQGFVKTNHEESCV